MTLMVTITYDRKIVITSHMCGIGNAFVLSVCVSVWATTLEAVDTKTSFLVWWYILTISGSKFKYQGQILKNVYLAKWT